MAIKYTLLLQIITLIRITYGAEKLVLSELTSTFSSPSVQWSQTTVTQCQTADFTEFSNQSVMGFFGLGATTSTRTFTNIPPHWSISIRFDLILYQSLDINEDYIYVKINGNTDTYVKQNPAGGYYTCITTNQYKDELVLYYYNITHSSSSLAVTIQSLTNEPISNEGYGFKNVYLYVDTCHDTCLTCSGPTASQCLSCPQYSTQTGNTCTCNSGYYALSNSCILSCQAGYVKDSTGKLCVQDFCNSSTCNNCSSGLCTSCKSGFYLLNGNCVSSCPSYSTLSGQQCIDKMSSTSYGSYLLQAMFNTYFGEGEVIGAGLKFTGFLGYNSQASRALTTVCNGKTLLGGAYLSSKNAQISRQFTGLQPHWSIVIGYTLYKIDAWNNENVQLTVDGQVLVTTTQNINDGGSNICGRVVYNDQINQISKNFTHTSTSLSLQFTTSLNSDPFVESYGIRELYILVDYCTSNCLTCDAKGCSKCSSTYFLYNYQCVLVCPDGFASDSNKTCQPCDSTCLTCSTPQSNTSCVTCKPNTYLNPDKSCKINCPSQYWGDNTWKCQQCNSPCYNCKSPGDSNSCTSCSGTLYLSSNQCINTCPSNTYKQTQTNNNICQPCDSSCKTCDGPNNNNCLSCLAPGLFYQQQSKTCVSNCDPNQYKNIQDPNNQTCSACDSSCATCSGPNNNNCLTCTGSLYLYQNKCIPNCPVKYYNNIQNNQCTQCDSTCYTCSGAAPNNCKSCQLPLYFDSGSNQCVQQCSSNQYPDSVSISCQSCDPSCLTCDGPTDSNCKSCKQGLFLQNNQCKSKCDDSNYVVPQTNICQKCDSTCLTCSGPSQSECLSCSSQLIFLNNSCLSECPNNYFTDQQQQTKECKECHKYCKMGCKGPLEEDCDSIKYQYQIIFYILTGKCFIWIASSLSGYFYDKKQSKIFTDTNFPPLSVNSDKISNLFARQSENQFLQENNNKNEEKQQIQTATEAPSQQNDKDLIAQQLQTLQFQMKIELDKMKRVGNRRPRQKFYKQPFYDKSSQIFECQLPHMNANQPTLTKSLNQFVPTQTNLIDPSYLSNQKELNKRGVQVILPYIYKYQANQIFKFTLLGNEWVSLFYFYDTETTRFIRATLIFLKYQAFFLSTEFVYESFQYLLILALLFSITVKQAFKIIHLVLVRKSFKLIAAFVFFFIAILGIHAYFWFVPQLESLKFLKDKTWSIYYGILFGADFIIFQQLFSFIEYIFTIKYLNALYNENKLANMYKYLANEYFIQKIR
ncbi:zinc finger lsd1 subclass family protein (macronuclear) [Tetrahymena thermophila SB210]|uniref:Zinc finger lsd1 subclass family protein n=1 Tax=Tetrahymena thermophila (strain SB210) TaxID=312017 RepID=Q22Z18_TETTS|nr:zinc finger lsd1 subclass family protein [Tetrahymena thermophila SB210]EAR90503.3 zinc finger lsd1 subclass family protein [Tetrahymena thermophila SB210]|eukprot:XP_001010748.3 zinc finger lsd1 subclass family protein [Tetrahymena thermophila SB210]